MAKLCSCSCILWKVKLASNESRHLGEEKIIEGALWSSWLLTVKHKKREMTSRLNYWEEPDLKFGKFSVYPYCKKMRKHIQKRILRVWLSNYLIRRFGYLWTLDITNYVNKKTTDSAKEEGDKTELRMAFRLQKFIGWGHRAIWLWTYSIFLI